MKPIKFGNFDFERLNPSNLYNTYLGMTGREQTFALIGIGIALFLIVVLPVSMATAKLSGLRSEAVDGREQISTLAAEIEKYNQIQSEYESLKSRMTSPSEVSLPSILESVAQKEGIKDSIDSIKNLSGSASGALQEVSADVRLRKVSLSVLINYLHAIENYEGAKLRLSQLEIRPRYDNVKELNVTFVVSTYQMTGE